MLHDRQMAKDGYVVLIIAPPQDATSLDRLENALLAMNLNQYANVAIMGDFNINWMRRPRSFVSVEQFHLCP